MARAFYLVLISCCLVCSAYPQDDVVKSVQLDEFVISAQANGFSVEEFVTQVMDDTTFYKAFLNLKYFPHHMEGKVLVFNNKEKEKGLMYRKGRMLNEMDMVRVELQEELTSGKVKNKKGEYRYLTAEMYDDIFFPKGSQRATNRVHNTEQELVKGSKFDQHKSELKKFMFNPGSEISSVPFIGHKMALFADHMVPFYDYFIWSEKVDSLDCWVFTAKQKEGIKDNKTVIKDMSSWFDKERMAVVHREYTIRHNSLIMDFDISMKVRNTFVDGQLVPQRIDYDGLWDIPFRKAENIQFWLELDEWTVW